MGKEYRKRTMEKIEKSRYTKVVVGSRDHINKR